MTYVVVRSAEPAVLELAANLEAAAQALVAARVAHPDAEVLATGAQVATVLDATSRRVASGPVLRPLRETERARLRRLLRAHDGDSCAQHCP